eukprot:5341267-Amphidinium_carterae.1
MWAAGIGSNNITSIAISAKDLKAVQASALGTSFVKYLGWFGLHHYALHGGTEESAAWCFVAGVATTEGQTRKMHLHTKRSNEFKTPRSLP